jgi:hypothetical protein
MPAYRARHGIPRWVKLELFIIEEEEERSVHRLLLLLQKKGVIMSFLIDV